MDFRLENIFKSCQESQFVIVPITTDQHRAEVLSFMQSQFRVQEPITNALSLLIKKADKNLLECSAQDTLPFYKDICSSCFKFDLSMLVHDHLGQLIGISLNSLWKANTKISQSLKLMKNKEACQAIRNGPYPGLENANRLVVFLEMVESELNSILNDECVLKLEIIAVHPFMGIASNLIKKCIEIANHINCSHIVTCATAVGSQNLFRKMGFETVHKVLFEDFLEEGVPVFRNLQDNGRGAELMIYKLN